MYQVSARDFGAVGDGVTDDTAAINAALSRIRAIGFGTLNIPSGTYLVNVTAATNCAFLVPDNCTIALASGAVLQASPSSADSTAIFRIQSVSNVTISGGTLIGDRDTHLTPGQSHGMGISLAGASNVTIQDCDIQKCQGDGIWIGYIGSTICSSINIDNVSVDGCYRHGMSVVAVNGLRVTNSAFTNNTGLVYHSALVSAGVDQEYQGTAVDNVRYDNCIMNGNANAGLAFDLHAGTMTNIVVTGCTTNANGADGLDFNVDDGYVHSMPIVTGHTASDNGRYGMFLKGWRTGQLSGATITHNNQNTSFSVPGLYVLDSNDSLFDGNAIHRQGVALITYGMRLDSGTGNIISNNDFTDGGVFGGLYVAADILASTTLINNAV